MLIERPDASDKVLGILDAVSPEMFVGGSDCCCGIVVADLLLMSKSSVPVLPEDLLVVRLESVCWDGTLEPVPENVTPLETVPALETSFVVESPNPEEPPLAGEESWPSKVADVPGRTSKELPILCGVFVLKDLVISVMVEAPKRKDVC